MNTQLAELPSHFRPNASRRHFRNFGRASLLAVVACAAFPAFVQGQPANDACPNRMTVGDGDTSFNSMLATTDGAAHVECAFPDTPDQQIYNDVWFNYTAPCGGTVTISTGGSAFNTRVAVYAGTACPATSTALLGCDDDSGTNDASRLELPAVAGQTYKIRVGGATPASAGAGLLTIECRPWQTHVYKDSDGDGMFNVVASYAVDPDVALAAYAASPDSQSGAGATFAHNSPGTAQFLGFGSGLESFLASQYPPAPGGQLDCPRCDVGVGIRTSDFGCPNLSCNPITDCNDYIHASRPVIICNDNPPCPNGKKCHACDAIVFFTTNVKPCNCLSYPEGTFCEPSTETLYHILISRLPLCSCVEPKPIKILIQGSVFTDCPFPVPPWAQTTGMGPVTKEAFQGMVPWGSNGFKYGGCHTNLSDCKITSIKMTLTSPCDTFDLTSNGDTEFPMTVISPDGKSIEFKGGSVQPGQTFYSRVPLSKGEFPAPGNPNKPRGTYLGQACPGKPPKVIELVQAVPNTPSCGNDSPFRERAPRGRYENAFQRIQFQFHFVNFAQYSDGTMTRFNNKVESIIHASIFAEPMEVLGPSETLPGAYILSDSKVTIISGPNNYLTGGLTHAVLIPVSAATGFDSVIQANIVWAQEGATINSLFMDEFLFPLRPNVSQTMLFRSNLLAATNNLTAPGESAGEVTFTNTYPLPSLEPIPTLSQWGWAVLTLLLLVGATIIFARSKSASQGVSHKTNA